WMAVYWTRSLQSWSAKSVARCLATLWRRPLMRALRRRKSTLCPSLPFIQLASVSAGIHCLKSPTNLLCCPSQ
ncbi:hypothetical protein M9458_010817, partial [Cirrhinus mrigala]